MFKREEGRRERIMGEFDQGTLYKYMEILQRSPFV
jgi:hypothetical protein